MRNHFGENLSALSNCKVQEHPISFMKLLQTDTFISTTCQKMFSYLHEICFMYTCLKYLYSSGKIGVVLYVGNLVGKATLSVDCHVC